MENSTDRGNALRKAKAALERQLANSGPPFKLLEIQAEKRIGESTVDLVASVRVPTGQEGILLVEVKSRGEPFFLSHAVEQLKSLDQQAAAKRFGVGRAFIQLVVAAPYISDRGRALLKRHGVGFSDLADSCYFHLGAFHDEKTGRKNPSAERRMARSLFSGKAVRVARALLEEPKKGWSLSELAKTVGLSAGYAHAVVRRLQDQLFISRNQRNEVVLDKAAELLDEWTKNYSIASVPTRSFFSFQRNLELLMRDVARASDKLSHDYAFTLHAGASLVAPFTRFSDVHLYAEEKEIGSWVAALKLRPAEAGGNVHLLVAPDSGVFYRRQTVDGKLVVCNTQLYVDLRNYPARGSEQAEFLRKEKLTF